MFIQLNDNSLLNLYYLSNVNKRTIIENEVTLYQVVYIMSNGQERIELFDNESDMNNRYNGIINKLLDK